MMGLRLIRNLLVLISFAFGMLGLARPSTDDLEHTAYRRTTNILHGQSEYAGIDQSLHLRAVFWTTSIIIPPESPALIILLSGSPPARYCASMAMFAAVMWAYGKLRGSRSPAKSATANPVQVLYLRPFDTDKGVEYKTKKFGWIPVADPESMETFDQEICEVFNSFGRVSALVPRSVHRVPVGPDEVVTTPDGEDWHIFIERALREARLVVLVLGSSASMLWELETALRVVPRERLLLAAPPGGITTVWAHVELVLKAAGWNVDPTSDCRLIIHGPDGPREFSGRTPYHEALGPVGRAMKQ